MFVVLVPLHKVLASLGIWVAPETVGGSVLIWQMSLPGSGCRIVILRLSTRDLGKSRENLRRTIRTCVGT